MRCQSDVMPGRPYCNQLCRDLGRIIFDGPKRGAVNLAVKQRSIWEEVFSRWADLNRQPTDYKSVALPLSYIGPRIVN